MKDTSILDQRVDMLPIGSRTACALYRIGTVRDLLCRTEADLLDLRNVGPRAIVEIRKALAVFGLQLDDGKARRAAEVASARKRSKEEAAAERRERLFERAHKWAIRMEPEGVEALIRELGGYTERCHGTDRFYEMLANLPATAQAEIVRFLAGPTAARAVGDKADRHEALISYRELAARTGIPLGTLSWWVRERRIPHVRLGARHVRFRWSDVAAWLDSRVRPPLNPVVGRDRR